MEETAGFFGFARVLYELWVKEKPWKYVSILKYIRIRRIDVGLECMKGENKSRGADGLLLTKGKAPMGILYKKMSEQRKTIESTRARVGYGQRERVLSCAKLMLYTRKEDYL